MYSFRSYDDDGVDVGMLIERLKRVDDDRFAVHEQNCLGLVREFMRWPVPPAKMTAMFIPSPLLYALSGLQPR